MDLDRTKRLAAILSVVVPLFGCSGGKGGKQNEAPTASAGADADVRIQHLATLDGTASADPEGNALEYSWDIIDSPAGSTATITGSGAQVSLTPDLLGIWTIRLVVSDGKHQSAPDEVRLHAKAHVAVFRSPQDSMLEDLLVDQPDFVVERFSSEPDSVPLSAAGTRVAYSDQRDPRSESLWLFDTIENAERVVSTSGGYQVAMDAEYIAWVERRNGQPDLFAMRFATGEEFQLTNSPAKETLTTALYGNALENGVVVWSEQRDNVFQRDVYAFDLVAGTEIPVEIGTPDSEDFVVTDGATVLWQNDSGISGRTLTSTTSFTIGGLAPFASVSGDWVAYADPAAGLRPTLRRLSTGEITVLAPSAGYVGVHGDWALYSTGSALRARQLSTASDVLVASGGTPAPSLRDGRACWTVEGSVFGTQVFDVFAMDLPAGPPMKITSTPLAFGLRYPLATSSLVTWSASPDPFGYEDVYVSADLGTTTTLASASKRLLDAVADDIDVAVFGEYLVRQDHLDDVMAALDARGIPMLSTGIGSFSFTDRFSTALGVTTSASQTCGAPTIELDSALHPAFGSFAAGSILSLDDATSAYPWMREAFTSAGATEWTPLASFSDACLAGETAIVTFVTPAGTQVLFDGAADDLRSPTYPAPAVEAWTADRRELLRSEIRWLATRRKAP